MQSPALVAALAAAALAGGAVAARADLVTAQSVVDLETGDGSFDDAFFPVAFPGRASALDGLYAIDVTLSSGFGNQKTGVFEIQYGPGNPAGELDFVIACGSDTQFVTLTHLDFYRSGDYSPLLDAGRRASIDLSAAMVADAVTHVPITLGDLTLNGDMEADELAGYDSVRAVFLFQYADISRLQIDFVANPEPGTMALFGLGAAALGGLVWRRRMARADAK